MKWREASGVLCVKRIPMSLKSKFYRKVVRSTMPYGSKFRAVDRRIEQSLSVAEMRMFRWTGGVTREDRIRNKYVRGSVSVM